MRICHLITRLIIGGAQENTVLTCRGLVELGHEVLLASGIETGPEGSLWSQARQSGARLAELHHMRRAVRPVSDLRAFRELVRLFRRECPEVVHTHSSKAGIIGRLAAARARVPIVVHTIHGMSFNRTQPAPVRGLYRRLERLVAGRTDRFVCVADAMTRQAAEAGIAPLERFVTVRSGMDTNLYRANQATRRHVRSEWGVAEDAVVVGTVARLFENKGYEEILAALPAMVASCPRIRFVWVGHGPHRHRYERRLKQLGLRDLVILPGLVPPDDVARLMTGFDILLHASRWEGLPRAVVQGLLTSVPAVSFDNDGAAEIVIRDRTGIPVPYGNIAALADAVVSLAHDAHRRAELGSAGDRLCRSQFDWHTMVNQLEELYRSLLAGRREDT